jgi:hypothetical protein
MLVMMSWAPLTFALPALVEEEGATIVGVGPVGALGEPAVQRGVQLWVDWDLSDPFAFAEDPR